MISIDVPTLVMTAATVLLNKLIPGWWAHHTVDDATKTKERQYLCEVKNDCEAMKAHAMQGIKPVFTLHARAVKSPDDGATGK